MVVSTGNIKTVKVQLINDLWGNHFNYLTQTNYQNVCIIELTNSGYVNLVCLTNIINFKNIHILL